jgi:hypothetical protein
MMYDVPGDAQGSFSTMCEARRRSRPGGGREDLLVDERDHPLQRVVARQAGAATRPASVITSRALALPDDASVHQSPL